MIYLIIYLSIGFGVWLGLVTLRLKQDTDYVGFNQWLKSHSYNYDKLVIDGIVSAIRGFIGSLILWPILLFFVEP